MNPQWVRVVKVGMILAGLVLAMGGECHAQKPSIDEINEVARLLSCPTCTGINLADCPTETCAQWRAEIGRLLAEGKSQAEILDYFAARYGDQVLQTPPAHGVFIWLWMVSLAAVVGGFAWWLFGSRRRIAAAVQATPGTHDQSVDAGNITGTEAGPGRWKKE